MEQVDVITLFEVLEHIDQPSVFLAECVKHLKPGGWVIGSTIARSPISFLTTKVVAEAPVVGIVPRGTHDWNKYINPEELRNWFGSKAEDQWGQFSNPRRRVYADGWLEGGARQRGMGQLLLWRAKGRLDHRLFAVASFISPLQSDFVLRHKHRIGWCSWLGGIVTLHGLS